MEKIFVIGINGSQRKKGGTVNMLKETLKSVEKHGGKSKLIHLLDYKMKPYHGNYYKKPDAESLKILKEIEKADGIVLATPVNWLGPTSLMKIFVDNLTYLEVNGFRLQGKAAGVLTHCWEDGGFGVGSDLAGILNTMGCIMLPYAINMRNKNIRKNKQTDWMWTDAKLLGKNIVVMAEMAKKARPDWSYKKSKFLTQ
jgi:multimeric flavodoxin WrbA